MIAVEVRHATLTLYMMAVEVLHAILHTHHRNTHTHIIAVGPARHTERTWSQEEDDEEEKEEKEEKTAHIKSNNPHLTGGEIHFFYIFEKNGVGVMLSITG